MSGHQILARVTQPGIDGLSKRIFWLAQSVNSDLIQGERGLNVFSLYQLSVLRSQLDSGLSLDTSQFRDQTTHVANIWGRDDDVSHEGLQRAVNHLARMYSDTLSLSMSAGSAEPCLLPLTANITDFANEGDNSTLSSFQSSLADSLQASLVSAPILHSTPQPLTPDTIPIIPRLIRSPPYIPRSIKPVSNHSSPTLTSAPTQPIPARRPIPRYEPAVPAFSETADMTTIKPNAGLDAIFSLDTVLMDSGTAPGVSTRDLDFQASAVSAYNQASGVAPYTATDGPDYTTSAGSTFDHARFSQPHTNLEQEFVPGWLPLSLATQPGPEWERPDVTNNQTNTSMDTEESKNSTEESKNSDGYTTYAEFERRFAGYFNVEDSDDDSF